MRVGQTGKKCAERHLHVVREGCDDWLTGTDGTLDFPELGMAHVVGSKYVRQDIKSGFCQHASRHIEPERHIQADKGILDLAFLER